MTRAYARLSPTPRILLLLSSALPGGVAEFVGGGGGGGFEGAMIDKACSRLLAPVLTGPMGGGGAVPGPEASEPPKILSRNVKQPSDPRRDLRPKWV